jgi:hypothetical protein
MATVTAGWVPDGACRIGSIGLREPRGYTSFFGARANARGDSHAKCSVCLKSLHEHETSRARQNVRVHFSTPQHTTGPSPYRT